MPLPTALDFSNNIRTHAIFVGVISSLDAIVTLLWGVAWDPAHVLPGHPNYFKHMKETLLYSGLVCLCFTIIYWIGFIKRQRICITVYLVFVFICFVFQSLGLVGVILQLNIVSAIILLIVLGVNAYVLLVVIQLRRMMLNNSLPEPGYIV